MAMNEDYVSYELAVKLQAAGFDEPCIAQWACEPNGKPILLGSTAFVFSNSELKGRDVTAPLLYHAQKWLREKWGIHVDVCVFSDYSTDADGKVCDRWDFWGFELYAIVGGERIAIGDGEYDSYEEALSEGIESALELIEQEKK